MKQREIVTVELLLTGDERKSLVEAIDWFLLHKDSMSNPLKETGYGYTLSEFRELLVKKS